jgi:hypothetical protein
MKSPHDRYRRRSSVAESRLRSAMVIDHLAWLYAPRIDAPLENDA